VGSMTSIGSALVTLTNPGSTFVSTVISNLSDNSLSLGILATIFLLYSYKDTLKRYAKIATSTLGNDTSTQEIASALASATDKKISDIDKDIEDQIAEAKKLQQRKDEKNQKNIEISIYILKSSAELLKKDAQLMISTNGRHGIPPEERDKAIKLAYIASNVLYRISSESDGSDSSVFQKFIEAIDSNVGKIGQNITSEFGGLQSEYYRINRDLNEKMTLLKKKEKKISYYISTNSGRKIKLDDHFKGNIKKAVNAYVNGLRRDDGRGWKWKGAAKVNGDEALRLYGEFNVLKRDYNKSVKEALKLMKSVGFFSAKLLPFSWPLMGIYYSVKSLGNQMQKIPEFFKSKLEGIKDSLSVITASELPVQQNVYASGKREKREKRKGQSSRSPSPSTRKSIRLQSSATRMSEADSGGSASRRKSSRRQSKTVRRKSVRKNPSKKRSSKKTRRRR